MTQREAEVILKVNSKEAQEKLERLEAQAADLRDRFAEAFRQGDTRGIDTINKQLLKVNKEIDNMRTNAANIRAAMVRLDEASPRELQRTIKLINNELNSGRVKRGTKEWDEYVNKLKDVQTELRKVKAEMAPDDDESFLDRVKNGINNWGATVATAAAAFAGVTMAAKSAVQAYADMEAEEANVRKYTGMTAEEVRRLNDEFKKLDTRTSREGLNKLAQEAGRLGKTSLQDVLGFVRAADQINVALDDLGEGATLTLSKLTGIFGDEKRYGTEQSLLKVGSVVNELSQNCSASAPYLAEFSSRLGGIAAQSKMTISQVMAFAAVLDTQNLAVEASSTAVGQLITKIYQEPSKIAKAAGLDVKNFSDMVKTDMNGALIMLFERLNQFGGMENLATIFDSMGTDGARAIPVLSALAGHVDELKSQQEAANNAFREGISVTNEFNVQNNTVQARLDKAKKGFNEMAVALGEQLLPVMSGCISGVSLLMRVMSGLVSFFVQHRTVILTLVAAITAYNVVMALHVQWTKIATTWTGLWTAAQTKFRGVAAVYRLLVAGLTNTVQFFTNGLKVNMAMQARWSKAMAGMSFGGWIGLVLAAASAVYLFVQNLRSADADTRKYEKSMQRAVGHIHDFDEQARKEKETLDKLFGALDAAQEGTEEYNKAKENIIATYGDYMADLIDEHGRISDLATAYQRLAESIRLSNLERGVQNAKNSAEEAYGTRMSDLADSLQQTLLDYGVTTREAASLTAKITSALNLSQDLDPLTIARIEEIGTWKRIAVDGDSSKWAKLMNNIPGLLGSLPDNPADIVNKMIMAGQMRDSTINQIDVTAREANPLRDIEEDKLVWMMEKARQVVADGGGWIIQIADLMAGTAEMVEVDADAARAQLEQLQAEYNRRHGTQTQTAEEPSTPTPTSELPESEKKQREREKKERKAREAAKKALKDDLDYLKTLYLQDEAENLAMYVTGQRNYVEYLSKKEQLEKDYAEDVINIHEDHNKLDIAAYGQALKSKAELLGKQQDAERKRKLEDVDKDHSDTTRALTSAFYDPSSPDFQNKKLLNQMLFQEDIRYLTAKRDLYAKNSKEWADLNRQISERINQDQLDKQKETAEAFLAFETQYRQSSGSRREQTELDILKELHTQGLITEKEYQRAVQDVKDKYRNEDIEKARKTQSQYADMVFNLYTSFSKFFAELGKEGTNFWDNLSECATASVAVVGAVMSQYSTYVNAERDLELAKTEKRYDKEIAAAGKNSKKKERLEKQKEADVAKIKKKYNDKAMKIELAQAIASTAQAAIAAYASAAAIPKVGWIMAPIAAGLATAAGMMQVATIKKQHEAEAAGYYEGGFTARNADNRREVGVVHANEFVANHQAVANPALAPVLRLIDTAQRNNTIGSLTAADVSNAIGQGVGVSARGDVSRAASYDSALMGGLSAMTQTNIAANEVMSRLSDALEDGIEAKVILDGEDGFHKKYTHFQRLLTNPKR